MKNPLIESNWENRSSLSRRDTLRVGAAASLGIAAHGSSIRALDRPESCLQNVVGTTLSYHLVAFDSEGQERLWNGNSCVSQTVKELGERPISDVFIFSHGWMGDIPQAMIQYQNWIAAMAGCTSDIEKLRTSRPDFSPLLIGIHWPSLPFGDEELRKAMPVDEIEQQLDAANRKFGNTPRSRAALKTIFAEANHEHESLPSNVVAAFKTLQSEGSLRSFGAAAPPGADAEAFDPQKLFGAMKADRKLSMGHVAGTNNEWHYNMLYLLASVSFWTMKDRARKIGETGVHQLLLSLQAAVPIGRTVRFHLMGHSFGCIVASSSLLGPRGSSMIRPISSLSLIQGALSHWSFANEVFDSKIQGYFRPILDRKLVNGPIITTQSSFDHAVGTLYPYAAGVAGQVVMAKDGQPMFPKYGAIGAYGIQGDKCKPRDIELLDVDRSYGFEASGIYNIDCSRVISKEYPLSGAHSDICHAEVAHVIWESVNAVGLEAGPSPNPTPPIPPQPLPPNPPPKPLPGGFLKRIFRRNR